jgi:hypothetical protein
MHKLVLLERTYNDVRHGEHHNAGKDHHKHHRIAEHADQVERLARCEI